MRTAYTSLSVLLLFLALLMPGVLWSDTPSEDEQDGGFRIGHVSIKSLVDRSPQSLQAKRRLDEEFRPRDEDMKRFKEEIDDMERELQSKENEEPAAKLSSLNKRMRSMKRKFRRMEEEFKEDLNIRRNEELADVQRTVLQAILEIAREENYDLLVQQPLFASKRIDITGKVLEKLEQMYEARENGSDN